MAGIVECMPSSHKTSQHGTCTGIDPEIGIYGVGDNDDGIVSDSHRSFIPDKDASHIRSRIRRRRNKKNSVFVATENETNSTTATPHRPVDFVCSQFPTSTNNTTGVTCGAMNPFSNDVPYNSAGLSLAYSIDTIPGAFYLSPNTKRRKRPPLLPSINSSSPIPSTNNKITTLTNNNSSNHNHKSTVQRRLTSSNISIPTSTRRGSFRSASPGVERFNYAKALLRSDHELEKLSRKIRAEINESELFELAIAAEKAAARGVDNFSGRASTFGEEVHVQQQQQEDVSSIKPSRDSTNLTNKKAIIPVCIDDSKVKSGDNTNTILSSTSSSVADIIDRPRRSILNEGVSSEGIDGSSATGIGCAIGFSEQSLLEQARATATAAVVVVATPTVQLPTSTQHQQPSRRSMGIESLRNVNEVIPHWKELHSHMRTHFYRENINTDVLVFRETKSSSVQPASFSTTDKYNPSSTSSTNQKKCNSNTTTTKQRGPKSFFDNIAGMRLLPDFQAKKLTAHAGSIDNNDTEEVDAVPRTEPVASSSPKHLFGTTLSSHLSPKKEPPSSSIRPAPLGWTHPNTYYRESPLRGLSLTSENNDYQHDLPSSLTARLPRGPESFDLDSFQVTDNLGTSPPRRDRMGHFRSTSSILDYSYHDSVNEDIYSNNNKGIPKSPSESRHWSPESKSILSTPEGTGGSSISLIDCESTCSTSPLHESSIENYMYESYPRLPGPSLLTSPSTPINNVIPRRKESGFSTPAHLRMIKRLHISVSEEKQANKSQGSVEQTKSDISQQLRHQQLGNQDDACTATPATTVYSHFEPNSIVDYSPARPSDLPTAPSLQDVETRYLALPTIQSSKSENNLQKLSRKFVHRKYDTRWLNSSRSHIDSPTTPTDSSSKIVLKKNEDSADFIFETPTSVADPVSESVKYTEDENSCPDDTEKISYSSKFISCGDSSRYLSLDTSTVEPIQNMQQSNEAHRNLSKYSLAKTQFEGTFEEKKVCDDATSNVDLTSQHDKDEAPSFPILRSHHNVLDLCSGGGNDDKKMEDDHHLMKLPRLEKLRDVRAIPVNEGNILLPPSIDRKDTRELIVKMKICEKDSSILTSKIVVDPNDYAGFDSSKSIHRDHKLMERHIVVDRNSFDTTSVCHSLPPTDANFKAAVQGVFSHTSLGSPRNKFQLKDWQNEGDNKEFLSNYFYCAKTEQINKEQQAAANEVYFEGLTSSATFGDGLACAEPCNGHDSPCFLFGIDTMCGGLMHFLPKDVDSCKLMKQRRERSDGGFSRVAARERSASFSMGKPLQDRRHSLHSGLDLYQRQNEESWLDMFQRAASDRFNFQFQSSDNELEKSIHPFDPPCLSRKVRANGETKYTQVS
jgi:hypothetical protein